MEKELNALTTSEFFSMLKNQKLYSLKEELMDTLIEELNKEKEYLVTDLVEIQKYVLDITKLPRKIRERPKIVNNFNFLVVFSIALVGVTIALPVILLGTCIAIVYKVSKSEYKKFKEYKQSRGL